MEARSFELEGFEVLDAAMCKYCAPRSQIYVPVDIEELDMIVFIPKPTSSCLHLQESVTCDNELTLVPWESVFPWNTREVLSRCNVVGMSVLWHPTVKVVVDIVHPVGYHSFQAKSNIILLDSPHDKLSFGSSGSPGSVPVSVLVFVKVSAVVLS